MGLLGIHWGQFPEKWEIIGKTKPTKKEARRKALITDGKYVDGLSGMTCVCPSYDMLEVLEMPDLKEERETIEAKFIADYGHPPKTETAESAPSTKADNPLHKEDFNSLLVSAATAKQSGDQT